jgi:hypothetical protein
MKKILLIIALSSLNCFASAEDIDLTAGIVQDEFKDFVKEFGTALLFNPMAPAEPLGITGFDISLDAVVTDISDDDAYWTKFFGGSDPDSYIPTPRLHVQKGLPFNIDVGAMYVSVPDSNVKLWGLEAKYAILEGTVATPALSVRASYSKLQGVDDVELDTQSFDILISKGFLMLTPYAGASLIRVNGSEKSDLVALDDVDETEYRGLVGVQFSPFPLLVINGEFSFGVVRQYGLKVGLRF